MLVDSGLERFFLIFHSVQGVSGALTVLMRDAIKPNLMQTLEVGGIGKGGSSSGWNCTGLATGGEEMEAKPCGKMGFRFFNWLG